MNDKQNIKGIKELINVMSDKDKVELWLKLKGFLREPSTEDPIDGLERMAIKARNSQ